MSCTIVLHAKHPTKPGVALCGARNAGSASYRTGVPHGVHLARYEGETVTCKRCLAVDERRVARRAAKKAAAARPRGVRIQVGESYTVLTVLPKVDAYDWAQHQLGLARGAYTLVPAVGNAGR